MRTTPPTDAAALRHRLGNVAVTLLAGVGVLAVGLAWLDHATAARTTTYASPEPAGGAAAPATVATLDPPAAGWTSPPVRATDDTTGRFVADVASSAPERTVPVRSLDPCPAPPPPYDASDVAVTVTLRRPAGAGDPAVDLPHDLTDTAALRVSGASLVVRNAKVDSHDLTADIVKGVVMALGDGSAFHAADYGFSDESGALAAAVNGALVDVNAALRRAVTASGFVTLDSAVDAAGHVVTLHLA